MRAYQSRRWPCSKWSIEQGPQITGAPELLLPTYVRIKFSTILVYDRGPVSAGSHTAAHLTFPLLFAAHSLAHGRANRHDWSTQQKKKATIDVAVWIPIGNWRQTWKPIDEFAFRRPRPWARSPQPWIARRSPVEVEPDANRRHIQTFARRAARATAARTAEKIQIAWRSPVEPASLNSRISKHSVKVGLQRSLQPGLVVLYCFNFFYYLLNMKRDRSWIISEKQSVNLVRKRRGKEKYQTDDTF